MLKWAHAILDNWSSLQQEIAKLRNTKGTLIGRLSLGVIPSGLPMAALIAKAIQDRHPGIELTVLSQSSVEILRNLEDFSIDVGLTYLDNEPIEGMRSEAIYMERYCLLVRADHELASKTSVTWAEAAQAAALPAHAQHAEPAHHRPRLPHGQRQADPAAGDQLGHQPVLERAPDGAGQHRARVLPGGPRTHVGHPRRAADQSR